MIKCSHKTNHFYYQSGNISHKGFFNIYQAKNGAIYLQMGNVVTQLLQKQIEELGLDVYSLEDFDYDAYLKHYSITL